MTYYKTAYSFQFLSFRGIACFAKGSLWRLLGIQFLFSFIIAAVFVWFINHAWIPVIDESIEKMPNKGEISLGSLNWPTGSSVHVQGPEGEPFMSLDIEPSGITNVIESVDLVLAFDSQRLFLGSSLGFGLLVVPYPLNIEIPFNKTELKPWWGARSHLILFCFGFLVSIILILSWSFLGFLYMFPVKIFSGNRLSFRGAWQLASAAHMPGAILMSFGILMYGLKQIELVHFAFLWLIHLIFPWFYLIFSPFFVPKHNPKIDYNNKKNAKSDQITNPFNKISASKKKSDNPFQNLI